MKMPLPPAQQRDRFWNKIYELALTDKDIVVITADMGAQSLDKFRRDLPHQFVNVGIAEQNAILIASGLCLAGKKVFTFAISSFMSFNCLEKIRVENCIMGLPLTIVGVGAGFGYPDSGPTHHALEDFAVMRALAGLSVFTVTDGQMAEHLALYCSGNKGTHYLRLERETFPDLYAPETDFSPGFHVLRESANGNWILSMGNMTHLSLDVARSLEAKGSEVGVIDIFRCPFDEKNLAKILRPAKKLMSLEEHFLPGGLGGALLEFMNDHHLGLRVERLGLPTQNRYCYQYGGRDVLRQYYGLGFEEILHKAAAYFHS